jgi:hypothetical protein
MRPTGRRTTLLVASLAATVALGACTGSDPPSTTEATAPTPSPLPTASRTVAGAEEAVPVLSRDDIHPVTAFLAENGNLLVWWELTGIRARDAFLCRYPVAVTWVPYHGWRDGVRPRAVHAWLLAEGMRGVRETATGFFVGRSTCEGRDRDEQAPVLVVDERGRLRRPRYSTAVEPPRDGAIRVGCDPPHPRGGCQFDPATNEVLRLPDRYSWNGTWHGGTSILGRPPNHVSGTWSADGGTTWNQFIDTWGATPVRRDGRLFAVTNTRTSWFGELTGGHTREGYVEWAPEDAEPTHPLPRSKDGWRSWATTAAGTLVGIGRDGVFISDGPDWLDVVRRDNPCGEGANLRGRFVSCWPHRTAFGSRSVLEMEVSADLGAHWTTVFLAEVVPPPR